MPNLLQIEYSVESYNTDPEGRAQQSELRKVFASSPQAAAVKCCTRICTQAPHMPLSG